MVDDRDRRIAWLEAELGHIRRVAADALGAYRAIGMGKGGWTARDRDAFAGLDVALRRPVVDVRPDKGDDAVWAGVARGLLLACDGPRGTCLSGATWAAIVGEADEATMGLRLAIRRTGADVGDLMRGETRPAVLLCAAIVATDEARGFPDDATVARLLAMAREPGTPGGDVAD